jgi:peptide/nickel transport system substrate-binding protein
VYFAEKSLIRHFTGRKAFYVSFLFIIIYACGFRVERNPNVLVEHLSSDPSTLNPITSTDAAASSVDRYIYESLLERDNKTLELIPKLAKSWTVSDDHLVYTFVIRGDVRWHDGRPFTVDDIIYSFERIKDPKVDAAPLRSYFTDVISAKKLNDRTVQFIYSRPYFKALELCGGMPIVPKHIFDDGTDFNKHPAGRNPIGTGPFIFESWETGTQIKLKKNLLYWDKKPALDGIVYKIIPNADVALQLLKKGDLDLAGLRAIQWERQTATEAFKKNFDRFRYYLPNYSYIGWNLDRPYFSDRRVRIAMTMLLDRETILKELLFGQGEIITGNFYRFGDAYNNNVKPYPFDPQKAKALLDEAGWIDRDGDGIRDKDGMPFRFTYLFPAAGRFAQSIGIILRHELSKVGIDMQLQSLEWVAFLKLIHDRDFDAVQLAWSTTYDEDPYQLWHSSQVEKGSNFIGFKNKEADALIEAGRIEFNKKKRMKIYNRLHELIHEEEPYTFLFTSPSLVAVAKRFSDVKPYRTGLDVLEWKVSPWTKLYEW